jgi:hypothetical protein
MCVVSILRAADSMADSISHQYPGIPVGKILIQRDEETALPKLFFSKLPQDIKTRHVLLVDPMLATGGSASQAVRVLKEAGVKEEHIIMLSIVAAPEGLKALAAQHPQVRVLCGEVDEKLNSKAYIVPGLGDFGDRFFGTVGFVPAARSVLRTRNAEHGCTRHLRRSSYGSSACRSSAARHGVHAGVLQHATPPHPRIYHREGGAVGTSAV